MSASSSEVGRDFKALGLHMAEENGRSILHEGRSIPCPGGAQHVSVYLLSLLLLMLGPLGRILTSAPAWNASDGFLYPQLFKEVFCEEKHGVSHL